MSDGCQGKQYDVKMSAHFYFLFRVMEKFNFASQLSFGGADKKTSEYEIPNKQANSKKCFISMLFIPKINKYEYPIECSLNWVNVYRSGFYIRTFLCYAGVYV